MDDQPKRLPKPPKPRGRHRNPSRYTPRDDLVEIRFNIDDQMRAQIMAERRYEDDFIPGQAEMCRRLIREALDRRIEARRLKSKRFIQEAAREGVGLKFVED